MQGTVRESEVRSKEEEILNINSIFHASKEGGKYWISFRNSEIKRNK